MSQLQAGMVLLNRMQWHASRWVKSMGSSGMAGLILVALSSLGYLGVVLPQQVRLENLVRDVAEEQARQQTAQVNPLVDTRSSEARLQMFHDFFPARDKAPELLRTIYRTARNESLSLAEGEYKYSPAKKGGIGRYQVDLPVRGSYVQIRKFIVRVMNSIPAAALNEVSFKREVVGSGELEAKVSITIFLGDK